jgi:hypothetical protein
MEGKYERRPGMSARGLGRLILNLLTLLVLLTTLAAAAAFFALFINPYWGINPLPPPTIPATLGSPTPTNTPALTLPPTWTATATFTPAASKTAAPTETPTPTPMTPTPEPEAPFALQVGSPARIQNFVNDAGCEWMGVFGQVFDLGNSPILNLTVHLAGELEGLDPIDLYAITGSASDLGPGGYLFNVADQAIASEDSLWIQLEDGSGNALSDQIFLDTSESCSENLIMVNWRQLR